MKKIKSILINICGLLFILTTLTSCDSDDIKDDSFYTFMGETVATYCQGDENLSIFYKLIEESDNHSLLSAYGHYTCFVPTDSAFNVYFKERDITYNDLTEEEKNIIIYNHIIKSEFVEYKTDDFQVGALPTPNMNDRFLIIAYSGAELGKQMILVNNAPVINKDVEVHNGIIHIVSKIVEPSTNYLPNVLREKEYFTLFSEAFELTHLGDSIMEAYDRSYKDPHPGVDYIPVLDYQIKVIHIKKLGYTIFAETDETFKSAGINSLNDLIEYAKRYYGTEDLNDYTSRKNPLNKFISYHMLNRQMSTSSFVYSGVLTSEYAKDQRHEYYETMLNLRLMEIKAGSKINTRNSGSHVGVDEARSNNDAINGYVHALTDILVYDETAMRNDVLNKRMRIDTYAIPPQFTNNNIRWNHEESRTMTPDFCDEYFKFNDESIIILWGNDAWVDYQGNDISIRGWYDFTLRLPPVPPGTYEIRFGYRSEPWRGIVQLFVDGQIQGIPIDLSIPGKNPLVGWITDSETNDNGVENDKMMRNRGYMKAPNAANTKYGMTMRGVDGALRVIVGTFTFQEYDYHYFRAKNVESASGEFQFDYIEYVPVSYLGKENID